MATQPFIGEIRIFAGNFAPRGWALCQGQLLSIAQNTALFSLLGTQFGGDGRVTFGLPDLRGRAALGQGQAPGLSNYVVGEQVGEETVTLTTLTVPPHTHPLQGMGASGNSNDPTNRLAARPAPSGGFYKTPPVSVQATLNPVSVGLAGGGQPHQNRHPYLGLTYIIALQGIFPARN